MGWNTPNENVVSCADAVQRLRLVYALDGKICRVYQGTGTLRPISWSLDIRLLKNFEFL